MNENENINCYTGKKSAVSNSLLNLEEKALELYDIASEDLHLKLDILKFVQDIRNFPSPGRFMVRDLAEYPAINKDDYHVTGGNR